MNKKITIIMGKIFRQLTPEQLEARRASKKEIQALCMVLLGHLQNGKELSEEELQHLQQILKPEAYANLSDHYNDLIIYGFRMAFSQARAMVAVFLDEIWSREGDLDISLLGRLTEGGYISSELAALLLKHVAKVSPHIRQYLSNKLQGLLISGIKIDPFNEEKVEELDDEDRERLTKLIKELGQALY